MEFVEAPAFTRHVADYLKDDDYRRMQAQLAANPQLGDVMPGTAGFRKMRWADTRRGKGRRGGIRIIYYYFPFGEQIWLVTLYDKGESDPETEKSLENRDPSRIKRPSGTPSKQEPRIREDTIDDQKRCFFRNDGRRSRDESAS